MSCTIASPLRGAPLGGIIHHAAYTKMTGSKKSAVEKRSGGNPRSRVHRRVKQGAPIIRWEPERPEPAAYRPTHMLLPPNNCPIWVLTSQVH